VVGIGTPRIRRRAGLTDQLGNQRNELTGGAAGGLGGGAGLSGGGGAIWSTTLTGFGVKVGGGFFEKKECSGGG
jgi:hypothetical protein